MKRCFIPLVVTLLIPLASQAEGTFRCNTGTGVAYQDVACTAERAEVRILPTDVDGIAFSRGKLQVGLPDLLVLNHRRWGTPQHITRNREANAWHEYWNYEIGANGGKQLHFVNGRRAGVEDIEPSAPAVSMTPAAMIETAR